MALKALMLRKRIDDKQKALNALIAKDADIEKREAELEASIAEATTEEEKSFLDEEIDKHEADKQAQAESKAKLEAEISDLEKELGEEEAEQSTDAPAETTQAEEQPKTNERKDNIIMNKRNVFRNMNTTERANFIEREDVKNWLGEIRSAIKEKRALTNVGLTTPEIVLPLLRENITNWSKLYDKVNTVQVNGEARQPIMGIVPEGFWTECCADLNELTLGFSDWTMDCYMVGAFFAVCNANLEDSDLDLANEIILALAQALGKALDKAIIYGRNTAEAQNMPQGIVSSLLQEAQPAGYPATARPWEDLHETHVVAIPASATDKKVFQELIKASSVADGDYSRGEITWALNDKTYKALVAESLSIDASGAIVAGLNGRMPVVGGDVVVLNFIPDNVIVFGYYDLYTLAERAGRQFAQSEHVRFLQNQTVFKATARYDGAPIIREAFGIATLNGATPAADAVSFAK